MIPGRFPIKRYVRSELRLSLFDPAGVVAGLERESILAPNGCRVWQGVTGTNGYGQVRIDGVVRLPHRVAWHLASGPIPRGLFVCHRCDNPPCINVDHLFLGTHAENMRDMVSKGRSTRGGRNGNAKLDGDSVALIRAELAAGKTKAEIARALNFRVPEIVFANVDPAFGRTEPDEEIQDLLKFSEG